MITVANATVPTDLCSGSGLTRHPCKVDALTPNLQGVTDLLKSRRTRTSNLEWSLYSKLFPYCFVNYVDVITSRSGTAHVSSPAVAPFLDLISLINWCVFQEKDNVPEDCGPVKDIWEYSGVDPVHDAGADAEGNRYVSQGGVNPPQPGVQRVGAPPTALTALNRALGHLPP